MEGKGEGEGDGRRESECEMGSIYREPALRLSVSGCNDPCCVLKLGVGLVLVRPPRLPPRLFRCVRRLSLIHLSYLILSTAGVSVRPLPLRPPTLPPSLSSVLSKASTPTCTKTFSPPSPSSTPTTNSSSASLTLLTKLSPSHATSSQSSLSQMPDSS